MVWTMGSTSFRRVTVQLHDAERATAAAESFGMMDARNRYADLGDARPLAVLKQLVVTGHIAADTAWGQITQNTKVSGGGVYAVMVDHLSAILDIARETGLANIHRLDAIELLVGLVRDGQIQALSDADGAELIMALRNLDVAGLAPLLDAPETHERVLGVLTKLANLGNTSAWGVIKIAFTNHPEIYTATLKQFLEDDNFPFHPDIISLAQSHVHSDSAQASLYGACYDLLVFAAMADREGAWSAIGALAVDEVGTATPAVETLLSYTSVRCVDEQRAALGDYDYALSSPLVDEITAFVDRIDAADGELPALDPLFVQQAGQLAEHGKKLSWLVVDTFALLRRPVHEPEADDVSTESAVPPVAAPASGSVIGGAGPVSGPVPVTRTMVDEAGQVLFSATAGPAEKLHALHALKTVGMGGDPVLATVAVHQLADVILAVAIGQETLNTALAILVELAVYRQVPAAQQQLSGLIDTCKQAVAHHADAAPDFWLSILQRTVELGQGEPKQAVDALVDLMHARADLRGLIGNILAYLKTQTGIEIPLIIQ